MPPPSVCVADWLFLTSLNLLGAGRNAILDCLYSPFVIFFAWIGHGHEQIRRGEQGEVCFIAAPASFSGSTQTATVEQVEDTDGQSQEVGATT